MSSVTELSVNVLDHDDWLHLGQFVFRTLTLDELLSPLYNQPYYQFEKNMNLTSQIFLPLSYVTCVT